MHTSGSFVDIHQKARVTLLIIRCQHIGIDIKTKFRNKLGIRDMVNLTQLNETLTKATSVDNKQLIIRCKRIHDCCFHSSCARTCNENYAWCGGSLGEFLYKCFVLKHDLWEFRRSEIRNLLASYSSNCIAWHHWSNREVQHFMIFLHRKIAFYTQYLKWKG